MPVHATSQSCQGASVQNSARSGSWVMAMHIPQFPTLVFERSNVLFRSSLLYLQFVDKFVPFYNIKLGSISRLVSGSYSQVLIVRELCRVVTLNTGFAGMRIITGWQHGMNTLFAGLACARQAKSVQGLSHVAFAVLGQRLCGRRSNRRRFGRPSVVLTQQNSICQG